jgi:hypothetical protein
MNNFSKVITTFTVCKFLEEAVKASNVKELFQKFLNECEIIGGDSNYFSELATRELVACRLLEQEGAAIPANAVSGGGIAGLKPEDIGVPVSAQKKHVARNSIFRRRKPNKYYRDDANSY